jgi:hypothetical protein
VLLFVPVEKSTGSTDDGQCDSSSHAAASSRWQVNALARQRSTRGRSAAADEQRCRREKWTGDTPIGGSEVQVSAALLQRLGCGDLGLPLSLPSPPEADYLRLPSRLPSRTTFDGGSRRRVWRCPDLAAAGSAAWGPVTLAGRAGRSVPGADRTLIPSNTYANTYAAETLIPSNTFVNTFK